MQIKSYKAHKAVGKRDYQERRQSIEPKPEMTQMLEFSDRDFRITMVNMGKVDNMC